MPTKRKVTQLRRIQNLYRRLQKSENSEQTTQRYVDEMKLEWIAILKSCCFGQPFHHWMAGVPEIGMPPWPLPTSRWLHVAMQVVQHHVTSAIAADKKSYDKKSQFVQMCDKKFRGSSQTFMAVKSAPPLPITEVYMPHKETCNLTWNPTDNQVTCHTHNPDLFNTMAPVKIQDSTGWIVYACKKMQLYSKCIPCRVHNQNQPRLARLTTLWIPNRLQINLLTSGRLCGNRITTLDQKTLGKSFKP